MSPETMKQQIQQLEAAGWVADNSPRAFTKEYTFADYSETLSFLMEMGEAGESAGLMPTIQIESGTAVNVRVGQAPAPPLSEAEMQLAMTLAAAE